MDPEFLKFPAGFLWGASTSAHQVEGGNKNDWTQWEEANAERLARQAGKYWAKRSPVWQEVKDEATDPRNYRSGRAADHYNRYEEDFDLAQQIGLKAYRFSIEWSRIEPEPGQFNQAAIEHYRKMIKALKRRGIEPLITIWHWPLPQWLSQMGGWANPEVSHYFIGYAALLVREFGPEVKYWITINESNVYTANSYLTGKWPPQVMSLRKYYLALANMVRAHRETYHIIKGINPTAQVGFAHHFTPYVAYRRRRVNRWIKEFLDWSWNLTFLYRVQNHLDFIGANHYSSYRINYGFNKRKVARQSDLGWELYPPAMYQALRGLRKYNKPIIITENGLADRNDRYRAWYIHQTLKQVHRAIASGIDVRGYLHWSLLDNFEWDSGFWPRFGLIEVDFQTMERKVRPSAVEYGEIIKGNGVGQERKES